MTKKILVWDLPIRLFHWLLVFSLIAAWYTSEGDRGLTEYHLLIGYFILGLVTFRIIWGFIGTRYARFSQFVASPRKLNAYFHANKRGQTVNTIGHNPMGGLAVISMLVLIFSQALSGLFMTDDVFTNGPYYESINSDIQKFMAFIHNSLFDLIVIVSTLHIGAILYYLFVKKLNLIKPMITGFKLAKDNKQGISSSKLLRAFLVIGIVIGFIYWLVVLNVPISEEYYF